MGSDSRITSRGRFKSVMYALRPPNLQYTACSPLSNEGKNFLGGSPREGDEEEILQVLVAGGVCTLQLYRRRGVRGTKRAGGRREEGSRLLLALSFSGVNSAVMGKGKSEGVSI